MSSRGFLSFVYHNPLGLPLRLVFRMRWFSQMMGTIFSLPLSRFMIPGLASLYHISLESYEVPDAGFRTVNDFFTRASKPGYRTFPTDTNTLGSPVDGCIEVFRDITSTQDFCIKGYHANLEQIFGPQIVDFAGGDVCFCRLRFSDYHRFHFFDHGRVRGSWERSGPLYSVDNTVLDTGLWIHNKSHLMSLETLHFGPVLWLEVGATNVGSIHNHKGLDTSFVRGEEKGFFELGGSAVLLVFQRGKIQWSPSILEASKKGEEYEVMTGQILGSSTSTLSSR